MRGFDGDDGEREIDETLFFFRGFRSAEFHEQVHAVLFGLVSVASKTDGGGMHELCKGCVALVSDSKKIVELFPAKPRGGVGRRDVDDAEDEVASMNRDTIVLCCFDTALAHVKRSEESRAGASARNGSSELSNGAASTSTGLMVEVQSLECAMNITNTACKLLECVFVTNPQNVAPLTTSELLFALSRLLMIGSHDVQLSAAAVLKNIIADIPIVLVPCDSILASVASVLTCRPLRKHDDVVLELVYTLKELAGDSVLAKHANVLTTSILNAIDSARDESIRAVLFDVLRMCLLVRPTLAIQAITLLPHTIASKGSDALVECLSLAFSNVRDDEDEMEIEKRTRLNEGEGEEQPSVSLDYKARSSGSELRRRRDGVFGRSGFERDARHRGKSISTRRLDGFRRCAAECDAERPSARFGDFRNRAIHRRVEGFVAHSAHSRASHLQMVRVDSSIRRRRGKGTGDIDVRVARGGCQLSRERQERPRKQNAATFEHQGHLSRHVDMALDVHRETATERRHERGDSIRR